MMTHVDEELREMTIPIIHEFFVGPLAQTSSQDIINLLPEVASINSFGVLRMQSICIFLQQALGGFSWGFGDPDSLDAETNDSVQHFERSRKYYELLNLPTTALLLFVQEDPKAYTKKEYSNLLLVDVEDRQITEQQRTQLAEILRGR